MTFAERLKYLREKAKMTQKEIAEKIGLTPQSYNNYEKRNYNPTPDLLVKMATALGVTVNELVGFQENEKERMLNILRTAGIDFKLDPKDNDALFINNIEYRAFYFENFSKEEREYIPIRISFNDLKMLIDETEMEIANLTFPIFKRFFIDRIHLFNIYLTRQQTITSLDDLFTNLQHSRADISETVLKNKAISSDSKPNSDNN